MKKEILSTFLEMLKFNIISLTSSIFYEKKKNHDNFQFFQFTKNKYTHR